MQRQQCQRGLSESCEHKKAVKILSGTNVHCNNKWQWQMWKSPRKFYEWSTNTTAITWDAFVWDTSVVLKIKWGHFVLAICQWGAPNFCSKSIIWSIFLSSLDWERCRWSIYFDVFLADEEELSCGTFPRAQICVSFLSYKIIALWDDLINGSLLWSLETKKSQISLAIYHASFFQLESTECFCIAIHKRKKAGKSPMCDAPKKLAKILFSGRRETPCWRFWKFVHEVYPIFFPFGVWFIELPLADAQDSSSFE